MSDVWQFLICNDMIAHSECFFWKDSAPQFDWYALKNSLSDGANVPGRGNSNVITSHFRKSCQILYSAILQPHAAVLLIASREALASWNFTDVRKMLFINGDWLFAPNKIWIPVKDFFGIRTV